MSCQPNGTGHPKGTGHPHCRGTRVGHGPTSFSMHEPDRLFSRIGVQSGDTVLDAGCGAGEYALHAATLVGGAGRVIALDSVEHSIAGLKEEAARRGVANIAANACDITGPLPVADACVDVVLLFTVLHMRSVREQSAPMFREFRRVLRPGGRLAVVECKKERANFGLPMEMRLSEEEVEALVTPFGFNAPLRMEMEYTYLLCFRPQELEPEVA